MSRDKLIILGVLVLGLLSFGVYKMSERDKAIGQPTVSAKDFPTISAPDDVDKISIVNGEKGEVVLEKVVEPGAAPTADGGAAGVWRLTKPIAAAANQQTVKDLIANLKELKVDSQINLKLDDDVRKDKQLDAAHGVHVVAWKGADKKADETFGKSGQAGELVILTSQPDKVWAAKGYSSYLYTKEPKDFRDKEILKFDDGNAAQVTIVNAHGTLSFTKGDKWVGTFDKNPIASFSEDKVKDMLRAYKALNADDFGDGKSVADTGLDKPDGTVTIVLKDGAGKYELLVGKTATGANRWAKRSDSDTIFQISSGAAEWATADAAKFASTGDAGAAADAGMKVSQRPQR
ncbi:MAG TPA: DUF4340 domain-containing protein [Polyangiaceae bacterium]